MRCPKCGFNLFARNEDGDDVCVRCGWVHYQTPIPLNRRVRQVKVLSRQELMLKAKEQHERNGWGAKEFVEYMGVSRVTAYRWLRGWGNGASEAEVPPKPQKWGSLNLAIAPRQLESHASH